MHLVYMHRKHCLRVTELVTQLHLHLGIKRGGVLLKRCKRKTKHKVMTNRSKGLKGIQRERGKKKRKAQQQDLKRKTWRRESERGSALSVWISLAATKHNSLALSDQSVPCSLNHSHTTHIRRAGALLIINPSTGAGEYDSMFEKLEPERARDRESGRVHWHHESFLERPASSLNTNAFYLEADH